jgi:hypothetical protein
MAAILNAATAHVAENARDGATATMLAEHVEAVSHLRSTVRDLASQLREARS